MSSLQGSSHILPPQQQPPPAAPPPQPPPKQKMSPMELRNADLVSRLLAATPPYLYNMSILPNTYFFSELLRSFVQLKNEQNSSRSCPNTNIPNGYLNSGPIYYGHQTLRRSKKRPWNMDHSRIETITRNTTTDERKIDKLNGKQENNNEPWMIKSMRRNDDVASTSTALKETNCNLHRYVEVQESKPESDQQQNTFHFPSHMESTSSNLVLPPPPPIWYPPIYSGHHPPYGFDPLNFFVDFKPTNDQLAVNGLQQLATPRDSTTNLTMTTTTSSTSTTGSTSSPSTVVTGQLLLHDKIDDDTSTDIKVEDLSSSSDNFKQNRHRSAFNVPNNNSFNRPNKEKKKFDVKSMGFDKSPNKIGLSYVLTHIREIYKNLAANRSTSCNYYNNRSNSMDTKSGRPDDTAQSTSDDSNKEQKKVDDLRALIGLELVVDYMSHKKCTTAMFCNNNNNNNSQNFCDYEKNISESDEIESVGSPPLEVVEVQSDV